MAEKQKKEKNMYDRLTKGDIEKMQKEIDERKLVLRKQLIGEVQEARAQGDLSENFEYYAAKRAKNQNESRIRYLERMIRTAHVIEEKASADDEVAMNKTVEVYFPDDDETETYRIVTTIRGNTLKGLISIDSPLGKALMHRHVGETVHVRVGDGGYDVEIRSISEAADEAEDEIRSF